MLKLNKYIRELGWNENTWPFNEIAENEKAREEGREYDDRYIEKDGFIDAESFELDIVLCLTIYSYLCYFRDNCMHGYPSYFEKYGDKAFDKWKEVINKMILGFKLHLEDEWEKLRDLPEKERKQQSKNRHKKIKYGMKLFTDYLRCLWW